MNTDVEKIIGGIIQTEMALSTGSVVIGSQNYTIPNTKGLFISISCSDIKVMSNKNYHDADNDTEIQRVIQRQNIQIDIMSVASDNSARTRKEEILMALKSVYSVQKQEENSFKIFSFPSTFVNSSIAEGGSQLNRFTIIIPVFTWHEKTKAVEYYDTFRTRVDNEQSIGEDKGIIEFTIDEETEEPLSQGG